MPEFVQVLENGPKSKTIYVHPDVAQKALDVGYYELTDPGWEMPEGLLRRKVHFPVNVAKKRRGRPPKQEVELVESDD